MKLHGIVDIKVAGERVLRDPTFWDKLRRAFGGQPDLDTKRIKASLEAVTLVEATRRALERLGARNAIALVIDNQVLFEDRHGRPDDLADLMAAFHDASPVYDGGFSLLRFAVEHEEAGLHLVIEIIARGEHPASETAARIVVSGRIRELEPRPDETAESYRARVEPLTREPAMFETTRLQFESFVTRIADAMRAALPDAEIAVRAAEAQIQQPPSRDRGRRGRQGRPPAPTDPRYDPYGAYYPSPMGSMLSMMMWGSMMSWAMTPHYTVVNQLGDTTGTTDQLAGSEMASAADSSLDGDDGGDLGGDGDGGDLGGDGDGGDGDWGGGDLGGDLGGVFGGGDFGGGDF